jgi:hypothetical protein
VAVFLVQPDGVPNTLRFTQTVNAGFTGIPDVMPGTLWPHDKVGD